MSWNLYTANLDMENIGCVLAFEDLFFTSFLPGTLLPSSLSARIVVIFNLKNIKVTVSVDHRNSSAVCIQILADLSIQNRTYLLQLSFWMSMGLWSPWSPRSKIFCKSFFVFFTVLSGNLILSRNKRRKHFARTSSTAYTSGEIAQYLMCVLLKYLYVPLTIVSDDFILSKSPIRLWEKKNTI